MTLTWLHKIWVYFWNSIGLLLAVLVILGGIFYGVLQLPITKEYLINRIENSFNSDRQAFLEIDELSGHIPFNFSVTDVNLYTDSSRTVSLASIDSATGSIDLRGWFSDQIILPSVEIFEPQITIDLNNNYTELFARKSLIIGDEPTTQDEASENDIGILIPQIVVESGEIKLLNLTEEGSELLKTPTLTLKDLYINSFLDYSRLQRFIDIEQFTFSLPEIEVDQINVFGQVFNDDQYLEFNAFNISTENNALRFSAEVDGINILEPALAQQLERSSYNIIVDELITYPLHLRKLVPDFPFFEQQIYTKIDVTGTLDSLTVSDAYLLVGNSELEAFGGFNPSDEIEDENFSLGLERLSIDSTDLGSWFPDLTDIQKAALTDFEIDGQVQGSFNKLIGNFDFISERGFVSTSTQVDISDSLSIIISSNFEELNLGSLIQSNIENTNLNGALNLSTNSFDPRTAFGDFNLQLSRGQLNAFDFDSLNFESTWENGNIQPIFEIIAPSAYLDGEGIIQLSDSTSIVELNGSAAQLDLKGLTAAESLSKAFVDMNYSISIDGSTIEDAFGQLTIDLPNTVIADDTLKQHQIYADFNSEIDGSKSFRLTSTPIDVSVSGDFDIEEATLLTEFWVSNLNSKIQNELTFSDSTYSGIEIADSLTAGIELDFNVKDLDLLRAYLPNLPQFETHVAGNSNFNLSSESILFNATLLDSTVTFGNYNADSVSVQVTGSFRYDEPIKSFSNLQIQANAAEFNSEFISTESLNTILQMRDDSIFIEQNIGSIAGENDFYLDSFAQLSDSTIKITIDSLSLGNANYQWQSIGNPALTYYKNESLEFDNFEFRNDEESLSFEGIFSDQSTDSVNYLIRNVDLARISGLINGRIDFSGILDADFTTKSLTRIPSIQGGLGINAFSIDERVLGDIEVSSLFNSDFNRFDTRVTVSTDSAKYPDYFTRTERRGQNITFNGYVNAPDDGTFANEDSLFYFDLDFESIDLWILPFIAPRVFTEMSGVASGGGSVWGNFEDFDFSVNYDIGTDDAIFFRPRFLDTFYFGLGNITLNREDGLIFNDLFVIDPSGGSAVLNGTYDLGHLGRIHEMDLTLEMDEFQFLNNNFDPDVAFFGDAYGSSTIRMTGTNLNPVLTTETPVLISDFSRIGIPLLEETEFDEDNKFIRFVENFDFQPNVDPTQISSTNTPIVEVEEDPFDRTFVERFTLDLQFVAQNPMEVQLIFDPITGDQIEAEGIGRLGIRLEDEQLSMFGQFDINGGTYQFVSGEIFTRRFDLEPGGTIIWEGEPANARLDLNAIYEARPDINTLSQTRSDLDSESSQRVPVELVLNVGGSLTAIENNFFFRLPNNFETRQNSTLNTQIAALNRNEDEKLIQAASFLLMGDFIPSATASTDATNTLTENFSGSGAVLNPLLSSQIISPLLSNQINSLLRSDIGSLDIDFNLNTYNNVDLGVALRLYNDRIILSREGQITGSQSNIGDIGATYRINNTLSVTAFHRQDPTFSNITGGEESQQAQDINGVGFEAEVSFNSWQEFFRKLASPFRRLFGKKEDNTEIASSD